MLTVVPLSVTIQFFQISRSAEDEDSRTPKQLLTAGFEPYSNKKELLAGLFVVKLTTC